MNNDRQQREGYHFSCVVHLDTLNPIALNEQECFTLTSYLFGAIDRIITSHEHCATCGAVVPELTIEYDKENIALHFTCHKIEKDGKTLIETDYKKFAEYIKKLEGAKN
jgi:hypothetical protein